MEKKKKKKKKKSGWHYAHALNLQRIQLLIPSLHILGVVPVPVRYSVCFEKSQWPWASNITLAGSFTFFIHG